MMKFRCEASDFEPVPNLDSALETLMIAVLIAPIMAVAMLAVPMESVAPMPARAPVPRSMD